MNSPLWTIDQVVFLCRHYPDMPWQDLKAGIDQRGNRRSMEAIIGKARALEIQRSVNAGWWKKSKPGNKPPVISPVRDQVEKLLAEHEELTVGQLAEKTGARKSSIWRALKHLRGQKKCHIARCQPCGANGQEEAVYRTGAGVDQPISVSMRREIDPEDMYAPVPIPTPTLGPWGLVW